jgi:hypothetical protein
MFTWEEAGLLRSMLLVIKWALVALLVGFVVLEREPLGAALSTGVHFVEDTIHPRTPAVPHGLDATR